MVDLDQLHGCALDLDEGNEHAGARAVGRNDHVLVLDRSREIVDLKRDVSDGLHKFGIWRLVPVPHPLHAEGIALVIAARQVEMRERDLTVEGLCRGDTDVVEPHERTIRRTLDDVTRIWPTAGQ
jgi:hypothetical protein